MSQREKRKIGQLLALAVLSAVLSVGLVTFKSTPVFAHVVPSPCDFTTGGGFVITPLGAHANFGIVGGCKPDRFFGHVNFVNHDTTGMFAGLHLSSDQITAYVQPDPVSHPAYRDICGTADTNLFGTVKFRVRTVDNAEPGIGKDKFGIKFCNTMACSTDPAFMQNGQTFLSTRLLAGGNIQLHKPAPPGTTGPSLTEDQITFACGGDDSGLGF